MPDAPADPREAAPRERLTRQKQRIMRTRILLLAAAHGAAMCLLTAPAATPKNNILLIIADDYGADSSALFNSTNTGAHLAPTPNIDKLGHSGVLFPNFYARPSCSQSRACVFTGRESFRTGVGCAITSTNITPPLSPGEYTLAKAFTTNAPKYHLASVGKWHLSNTGDLNTPLTTGGWTNFSGYMGPMVQNYTNWTKVVNGSAQNATNYSTTDQANDAISFIQAQGTNLWFLWLAFNAPHAPIHKPPTNLLFTPAYINLSGTPADISANGRPYQEAMTQALDTEIGRLLAFVPTNTDIIFMGDNGTPIAFQQLPYYYDPTNGTPDGNGHAKFTLYEGGSRTPFFITGPDVANVGRTNYTLVNEVDLFQTIQELAGINVAATLPANVIIDSRSLLPALQGDVLIPTSYMLGEQFNERDIADGWTLSNPQFKLIHFYDHLEQLYDLSTDPYEHTNLFAAALTATARSNFYSLQMHAAPFLTLANTANTRNLLPYPAAKGVGFTNGSFSVSEQYTLLSTNGSFPNPNQSSPTQLKSGGTNLDYYLILWRSSVLTDPLAWMPVATNLVTGTATNSLVSTNGLITDLNANADHYFYQVRPYIP
jgi:arylsulfatase B